VPDLVDSTMDIVQSEHNVPALVKWLIDTEKPEDAQNRDLAGKV